MSLTDRLSPFHTLPFKRGKLYVFEGLDRSGKTTQISYLEGMKKMRFPSARSSSANDYISTLISNALSGEAKLDGRVLHLLFAADRWNRASEITDALENGIDVVIDRYSYSGAAYTLARHMFDNPECDIVDLQRMLTWAISVEIGLPKPDVVFLFDADPEELAKRADYGSNDIHEKIPLQVCIRKAYNLVFGFQDDSIFGGKTQVVKIDATQSKDEIRNIIQDTINS